MTTRIDTPAVAQERSLAGTWLCRLDTHDRGLRDHWYVAPLNDGGDGEIELPGTTDQANLGEPLSLQPVLTKEVLRGLHRNSTYIGPAWYQTEIEFLPQDLSDRTRWTVSFERVIWESLAWLDGVPLGRADSLSTPHEFSLPAGLRAGRHLLTVRVDNRRVCDLGGSHAYTEETQSIWNGLVGSLRLRPRGSAHFRRVRVTPCVVSRRLVIECDVHSRAGATINARIKSPDGDRTFEASRYVSACVATLSEAESTSAKLEVELGADARLWDEFTPSLYEVSLTLVSDADSDEAGCEPVEADRRTLRVGLRAFKAVGNELRINDRPVFLRGSLECCIFPGTGYPPCEIEPWQRIMKIAKSYGLNHLRFHSYCPPEAAFDAADEAGMYLQVELPNWCFKDIKADSPTLAFLEAEGRRILDAYANHPSFVLLSLGNELPGDFDVLDALLNRLREYDDRPLYTSTSYSFSPRGQWPGPADDFYITQQTRLGWTRGQGFFNSECPTTDHDFSASVRGVPAPVITHEVGQYSIYPNVFETDCYRGPLRPLNFEAIRHDLEKKNLLQRAPLFTAASGRWAAELYREDIERALRTDGLSGIQLLDLHDFPGQSTALVGLLDAFWNSKGIVSPDWFARFCRPTTLLLRLPQRVYQLGDTIRAQVQLAHFGSRPLDAGTVIEWSLRDDKDSNIAFGHLTTKKTIMPGERPCIGTLSAPLHALKSAARLRFGLSIRDADISSEWNIWAFPPASIPAENPPAVTVRTSLDAATVDDLEKGARLLLTPHPSCIRHRVRGQFVPVFWSPVHFPMQPGTQGLLIDSTHPALADFPTDTHTDWHWWDLTRNSTAAAIEQTDPNSRPIVQFVDHFGRNSTPALIYEARVGKGRLLVCTLDISSNLQDRPVARQLRQSLLRYAAGEGFNPLARWTREQLESQFVPPSPMANACIVDVSSHQPGCEPSCAIDGEVNSFWHSDWSAGHDYPHHLTIDLGSELEIHGVRLLPRQDGQKSGLIDAYSIELSCDGNTWDRVADGRFSASSEEVVEFAARYEGNRFVDGVRPARFLRLLAISGYEGTRHASLAELSVIEASR